MNVKENVIRLQISDFVDTQEYNATYINVIDL